MLDFTDHVQKAWLQAVEWTTDNSYSDLNATAQGSPPFPPPPSLQSD